MSWMIPDIKLDPDQKQVRSIPLKSQQSTLIQGPAGSGKSVMLVKILKDILQEHPSKKICMVLYTRALIDMMKVGIPDSFLNKVQIFTTYEFKDNLTGNNWDVIIIDEFQDIEDPLLNTVFKHAKQVILAGDPGQSIYEKGCSKTYFDTVNNLNKPELKTIHRVPKSIQRVAGCFADNPEHFMKYEVSKHLASVSVQLKNYPEYSEEIKDIWLMAREYAGNGLSSVIIFPTNNDLIKFSNNVLEQENKIPWKKTYKQFGRKSDINYEDLNNYLRENSIQLQVIGKGAGSMKEADTQNLVSIMTYHSAKGLDFEAVFLPKLTQSTTFWSQPDIARRMFFVALTRSRRNLFLSYYGDPHEFVKKIPKDLLSVKKFSEQDQQAAITISAEIIDF